MLEMTEKPSPAARIEIQAWLHLNLGSVYCRISIFDIRIRAIHFISAVIGFHLLSGRHA